LTFLDNIGPLGSVMSLKSQLPWVTSRRSAAVLSGELPFSGREKKMKLLSSYGTKNLLMNVKK